MDNIKEGVRIFLLVKNRNSFFRDNAKFKGDPTIGFQFVIMIFFAIREKKELFLRDIV